MPDIALTSLVFNAALLLVVVLVLDLATSQRQVESLQQKQLLTGAILGGIGISIMMAPLTLLPGLVFDVRSVLIAVSGLFFGAIPTAVAMVMTVAYRLTLGGVGAWAGVAVILASGLIGIAWRQWRRPPLDAIGWRELYGFGLVVHLVMVAMMLTLPREIARNALASIALPVLVIHPLLTVALGLLLSRRSAQQATVHALEESEARYHSLFDSSHAVMLIIDPDSRAIVAANPAASDFYGWTREQLQGMNLAQINTLSLPELDAAVMRVLGRQQRSFEVRHRLADGSIRDVEVFSAPIRVGDRHLLYSIVHDISERKRAETHLAESEARRGREQAAALETQHRARLAALNLMEDAVAARVRSEVAAAALRESEARFRSLSGMSSDFYWETDAEHRYTQRSADYDRNTATAFPWDAKIGKRPWEVPHVSPDEAGWQAHRAVLAAHRPFRDFELSRPHADGTVHHFLISADPVFDESGAFKGYRGVGTDITERKTAEARLRKLSLAVGQSPESIVITNVDAEIEYVNDSFVRATGYSREEAIGQNPRILQSGKTAPETYREMWAELSEG
ncbi:MAG: PAS domain S-box protein, partial [Sulfuritalea sp.]|nr:PAS domain S-box protein [Sulfuritalea sp.]